MPDKKHEKTKRKPPLFYHGFLGVFFVLLFGFLFSGEPAFGDPLVERVFNISISASDSSNMAFTPMYREGVYPARSNLLRVASVETGFLGVLIFWFISKTVNSIPLLYRQIYTNQEGNVEKSDILPELLYIRKVIFRKILKIPDQTLDGLLGLWYSVYMSDIGHIDNSENGNGVTDSRMAPKRAKGDFYERRTEKFSGMA